jgi:hypothetical protein
MFKMASANPFRHMSANPHQQPDDADELFLETLNEMDAEARIAPVLLLFPTKVIEAIEVYEKAHSMTRQQMIWTVCNLREDWTHKLAELLAHLIEDPASFEWPVQDPLLCVLIAYLQKATQRWARKVHEKYLLGDEEDDPADWWKTAGPQP